MSRARLILLRHASAVSSGDDAARTLTPLGIAEAAAVGRTLLGRGWVPDRVLCSTATRARETLEHAAAGANGALAAASQIYDARLYLASPKQLLVCVAELNPAVRAALVIAHNPGLFDLARALAGEHAEGRRALTLGFPPATMVAFDVSGPWTDVSPKSASYVEVVRPF